jgi:hypothetical protein
LTEADEPEGKALGGALDSAFGGGAFEGRGMTVVVLVVPGLSSQVMPFLSGAAALADEVGGGAEDIAGEEGPFPFQIMPFLSGAAADALEEGGAGAGADDELLSFQMMPFLSAAPALAGGAALDVAGALMPALSGLLQMMVGLPWELALDWAKAAVPHISAAPDTIP